MAQRKTARKTNDKTRTKTTARSTKTSPRKAATPKGSSRKAGTSATKSTNDETAVGDCEVTIDRRRNPDPRPSAASEAAAHPAAKLERRKKVNRRRQIDPTTCERDYTDDEVEFMNAIDDYKRTSGRMFPTCSEVLEVLRNLGYLKLTAAQVAATQDPRAAMPASDTTLDAEYDGESVPDAELCESL